MMSIPARRERRNVNRLPVVLLFLAFLTLLSRSSLVSAADNYDGLDDAVNGEDAANGDDASQAAVEWTKDFNEVSVMAVSCVNYNNGHMIKFDFYDTASSYQCHFTSLGAYVVSIAHYMRAHFNRQALLYGSDFRLPGDAGYLNCVMLQETEYASRKLYAKIGCMQRETYTSTKLQLHVYIDSQCSVLYDDGETSKRHATKGYEINGYYFSTHVSFRPPFYSCQTCSPDEVSETFNKKGGNWYDDDYISSYGTKKDNSETTDDKASDADKKGDDYFNDDVNLSSNDDVAATDDAKNNANGGDDGKQSGSKYSFNDDYYNGNRRELHFSENIELLPVLEAIPEELAVFETNFWRELEHQKERSLYENYYDVGDWNMCNQIHKYGVWCNEECKSLDAFRVDQWSKSDIFLLVIMCVFMAAMMLLVVAKRLKASQKARLYGDENYKPGLPPLAMGVIFFVIITTILALAELKFVNETLVFAVVTCILLFIYMLKLTLFESRRPVLLAAPRHDLFDNPLDDRLFD